VNEPAEPAQPSAVGAQQPELRVWPLQGIGEVRAGDDLGALIATAARGPALADGDILAVTQKIVSKAEGRIVELATVEPSPLAVEFAAAYGKDPRHVEVVLRESRRIVKMDRGLLISETRHGFVCANAGVDASNVPGEGRVVLLPIDPDASAERIRRGLAERLGVSVGVLICDTFGRVWRTGLTNVAIGVAGLRSLLSYVGQRDPYGYDLRVTEIAVADEIAAAAELMMGKIAGHPVVVLRGLAHLMAEGSARALVRAPEHDLFR
jgi:coenzyme F420-0:L-glutamate ligase / coenzyme F420-1:gamma-L-glutamate ligase